MPIIEFLCKDCNRIFNFLARTSAAACKRPRCPKCGGRHMTRKVSSFAVVSKRSSPSPKPEGETGPGGEEPDLSPEQEARLEREMTRLASQMDSIDENDPRQMGALMRRLTDVVGEDLDPETDELIRRLEAGEDPDAIEEKMEEAFGEGGGGMPPTHDGGLYDL
jgi:putative FmdB family regulatory protein